MAYPTTEDLVAASTVEQLIDLTSAQQDALRTSAIAAVEEFAGQRFDQRTAVLTIDGQGADILYLPERLAELAAIELEGTDWPTDSVVISDDRSRLHKSSEVGLGYYEQAMTELTGERFPLGFGNVVIAGTWGWLDADFPEPVEAAIRADMEDTASADDSALSDTIRTYRHLGIRSLSQGNLAVSFAGTGGGGGTSGVSDRVQRLLMPYIWTGPVGALA